MSVTRVYCWAQSRVPRRGEDGASLVEYALLIGLIAIVCIAAIAFLGTATSNRYSSISGSFSSAGG